jgi:hypothetical protein
MCAGTCWWNGCCSCCCGGLNDIDAGDSMPATETVFWGRGWCIVS